ncbi:hypothetical protein ACFJIV_18575 [Mucilaginibacter sp. UC70_90]
MKYIKRNFIFGALLLAGTGSYAQQEVIDTAAFSRIRKAELSSSQIPQIAHYLTDVSGPRLTNSPGYARAASWAVATMKKSGNDQCRYRALGHFWQTMGNAGFQYDDARTL